MNNYSLTILDYPQFLHKSYQKLSHLPGFILLESSDRTLGRYDILSAYPYDRFIINDTATELSDLLNAFKEMLPIIPSETDLPFQGGAIGYVSYDLGERLFNIKSTPQTTLNNMPLLDFGLYDWAIIADHYLKKVTLFAANRHPSTRAIIQEIINLWQGESPENRTCDIKNNFKPLMSKGNYQNAFLSIQNDLLNGRSYQVNLTQPFQTEFQGDVWELYKKIVANNPVPFSAFIRTHDADILSFSPERLLLYDQTKLLTSPIKGTIGRSNNLQEDERLKALLISSEKNRAENVMIVDLLRNDLGKIAKPGSVHVVNLCTLQSYNAVHHLVSDIEAECIEDLHPLDAFIACFPGGSITGAPKLEAMKTINEHEEYSRGIYCGSIGYFSNHGRFDTNIAIRTVTAKNTMLHLAAGGGIVIDSNCEDEYGECYTKIAAIVNAIK